MSVTVDRARPTLVLASASAQRRALLAAVGVSASIEPVHLDEQPRPGESPEQLVTRLAGEKAAAAARAGVVVVAADTVIDLDGSVIGKPSDSETARLVLERLSGRSHRVLTGLAVITDAGSRTALEATVVTFRPLSTSLVDWYLSTGEHHGKAGSYAIQGRGGLLVERIDGNYQNVVGLPLVILDQLLTDLGWPLWSFRTSREPVDS